MRLNLDPHSADRRIPAMTVRFGLVGYGLGGRVFHAPLLASADGVDFAGVVTANPERRAAVDEAGLSTYDDLAALAADGVRAVAISTPATTHADLAREAIAHGLAGVVDKPVALAAESARGDAAAPRPARLAPGV